jgi:hypothetical protein
MIQTVVYAWIMRTIDPKFSKAVKIFNIRLGLVLRLEASIEQLTTIVVSLLKGKYERAPPSTEADFLSECKKIIWKIKNPNGEILEFFGYNSFKKYVIDNSLNVSVTTLRAYGKNKGWIVIDKIKQK